MKNIMDKAAEVRSNADSQIKQIQSDKDLTQTAKAKRSAEIRAVTNEKITAYKSEHYQSKKETR